MIAPRTVGTRAPKGQVVVLVALMMVVLVGITGLAVDVSGGYLAARYQRGVADAAALAGAQDLQSAGSRSIPANGYTNARVDALKLLARQLGSSYPTSCPAPGTGDPNGTTDIVNCLLPGTDYYVSIKTPSPSCQLCDPTRSVQVTIRRPHYGLAFAKIFGLLRWNIVETSVAGINYAASYGVVTLRPPQPSGANNQSCSPYCDGNYDDVKLSGNNTVLNVFNSDIGTNTNMAPVNQAVINLQPGYNVYRYDQYQFWTSPPPSIQLSNWIDDPNYSYPSRNGAPTYTAASGVDSDATGGSTARCQAAQTTALANGYSFPSGGTVTCYRPGIYQDNGNQSGRINVSQNTSVALLEPGVYFLDQGAGVSGTLIGGYEAAQPGVALVFPESGSNRQFNGNNAVLIALNFGSKYQNPGGGALAAAAVDASGNPVQTGGTSPILMTLLVTKNPNCYPGPSMPASCRGSDENGDATLQLPGNANLFVAGVQYAPTDNVSVNGNNSNTNGQLGQIIAWTITYTGGAVMNQVAATAEGNGILRLDAVCSGASLAGCNNVERTVPIP